MCDAEHDRAAHVKDFRLLAILFLSNSFSTKKIMSGDTEEMTIDGNSINSALVWTDNPEGEYFRSMMTNRMDDSLIGDSTVRDIYIGDGDGSSNSRNNRSPPRLLGGRDTSGLSDAESNTVDNIFIGDESILAMRKTLDRVFDDGTLATQDNEVPPITRTQDGRNQFHPQCQEQDINDSNQRPHQQSDPHDKSHPQQEPQWRSHPELNIPYNNRDGGGGEISESVSIPGFIFVTDGHPSIINTRADLESGEKSAYEDVGRLKRQKVMCLLKSLIACLSLVVIIASTVVGVLVYRSNMKSSILTSSSRQNDDFPFLNPNVSPTTEPTTIFQSTPGTYPISKSMPPSPLPTSSVFPPTGQNGMVGSTESRTPSVVSFPENAPLSTPTVSPTAELTAKVKSNQPTVWTTQLSSVASTSKKTALPCVSSVTTDKACYRNGENIEILFNNCEPTSDDWIGVYPARQGWSNLRQPRTWLWTCGSQFCNNPVASGEATFYDAPGYGSFRALLLRNDGSNSAGYSAYAIGNRFTISSNCISR